MFQYIYRVSGHLLLVMLKMTTVLSHSVVSSSLQPCRLKPARLLCPWGFSRQEYWSGLPCPPPGDLPHPGIKPRSPELQADSLPFEPPGKPKNDDIDMHVDIKNSSTI